MNLDKVVTKLKEHEGFRGMPYDDHLGNPTIGYGTLLPLSKAEATYLLRYRLSQKLEHLKDEKNFFFTLPELAQEVVLNMAYQMGVEGVLKFRNMWDALQNWEFERASKEMLDSLWAVQTPIRAQELADRMKSLEDYYHAS